MPPKLEPDENLKFLYTCLKASDYTTIDWNIVGAATDIKPNAARMRFTRLRNAIDGKPEAGTDAAEASRSTTPNGTLVETSIETPVKTPKKSPKKASPKKTPEANDESPTKKTPTKRKKKDASCDKDVKKAKKVKSEETVEERGVEAGIGAGDGEAFHDAIDKVEEANGELMVGA